MQTKQQGHTDAVPAAPYKLTRAVIQTVFSYRRWVAYSATPEGMLSTNPPHVPTKCDLGASYLSAAGSTKTQEVRRVASPGGGGTRGAP